jgi:hypothetical protein
MVLETLVSAVAEAVFGYLLRESGLAERARAVLRLDPERRAFQTALAEVCDALAHHYSEGTASLQPFAPSGTSPAGGREGNAQHALRARRPVEGRPSTSSAARSRRRPLALRECICHPWPGPRRRGSPAGRYLSRLPEPKKA